jgi:hypothetical protein
MDMKKNEIVWRTLADCAIRGQRRWDGLSELAARSEVTKPTVYQALSRLVDLGIVRQEERGGFTVTQAAKLLDLIAAHRNLPRDVIARTTLEAAQDLIERDPGKFVFGGPTAAIHHLGGRNTVATPGTRILYTKADGLEGVPPGDEVLIVRIDQTALDQWRDGYASPTQTYADLWNLPGWQAAEFTRAMRNELFPGEEWDQGAIARG